MGMNQHSSSPDSWVAQYGVAAGSVAAAILIRLLLINYFMHDEAPFLLLLGAVLVAAVAGGLGPGITATLLAVLASNLFIVHPPFRLLSDPAGMVRVALFAAEGVFISVLGARLRKALRRAELSEAETRRLEQEILDAGDAERRRIGQDLHDGLGQHLTGVAFLSKALQEKLSAQSLPEASDATKIARLVSESIGQTRALAKGLAPLGLEDGGLAGALSQLAASTSSVFGIECSCSAEQFTDLPDLPVATHLFRIAQEALSNAVRHGQATRINMRLDAVDEGRRLRLQIEDNGKGMNGRNELGGMGLQIMGFRARMIGGALEISSSPTTGGTVITCEAPFPAA